MNIMPGIDPDSYRLEPELAERITTPALIIFMEKVDRNIQQVIAHAGGDRNRWRPHVKTTKIPQVWERMIEAGVRQFKCATTREAAVLLETLDRLDIRGADLLIAYTLIGPALERAADLAREHDRTAVSVLCEDPNAAESVPIHLGIFVDVNPQMNRTGVELADRQQIVAVAQASGERFRGVHAYEGHIRDDEQDLRRIKAWEIYEGVVDLCVHLVRQGCQVDELITSGAMTFLDALAYRPFAELSNTIHRISPGTVVFSDTTTQTAVTQAKLQPAAVVASRVVSRPTPNIATCDAGSKAIAAEAGDPCAAVIGHPELIVLKPSEEHLPLSIESGPGPARGELLLLVPRHVCPTVNLAQEAVLLRDDGSIQVVPVSAAGHELGFGAPVGAELHATQVECKKNGGA